MALIAAIVAIIAIVVGYICNSYYGYYSYYYGYCGYATMSKVQDHGFMQCNEVLTSVHCYYTLLQSHAFSVQWSTYFGALIVYTSLEAHRTSPRRNASSHKSLHSHFLGKKWSFASPPGLQYASLSSQSNINYISLLLYDAQNRPTYCNRFSNGSAFHSHDS